MDAGFGGTVGAGRGGTTDGLEWELDNDDLLAAGDHGRAAGLVGTDGDDDEPENPEEMEGCNSFTTFSIYPVRGY
jgi:hypothetical protein